MRTDFLTYPPIRSSDLIDSDLSGRVSSARLNNLKTTNNELWMAIYMPLLPLVACMSTTTQTATIVCQRIQHQFRVISANKLAENNGICLNMGLSVVRMLAPQTNIIYRNLEAEQLMMQKFATLATSWSPTVVIQHNQVLLLEIGSTLRLHQGLSALIKLVYKLLPSKQLNCCIAVTSTPASAVLCARSGYDICVTDHTRLISQIGGIAVRNMNLSKQQHTLLAQLGIEQLSDLLRLPRDGLARRMGLEFLKDLDKLIGKRSDPQPIYKASLFFKMKSEFEDPIFQIEQLLPEMRYLLLQLEQYLQKSCSAIHGLEWRLSHEKLSCTRVPVRLNQLQQRTVLLISFSQLAIESSFPTGGVTQLTLNAHPLSLSQPRNMSLLESEEVYGSDQLLNSLYSRLGHRAVSGIRCQPDHKPENAWANCQLNTTVRSAPAASSDRPLWLYKSPKLLATKNGRPFFYGSLELTRHERIATNWWQEKSIQRDYYQARSNRGIIWIFRELKTKKWYIHGIF